MFGFDDLFLGIQIEKYEKRWVTLQSLGQNVFLVAEATQPPPCPVLAIVITPEELKAALNSGDCPNAEGEPDIIFENT